MGRSASLLARLRVGSRLRRLFMALCVLFATPNWVAFGIGAAVVVLAEIGVLLSYAALLRNRRLTTHGPYAVCRNPVYFCACAHGFGLFILSGGGAVCGTPFPQELWLSTLLGWSILLCLCRRCFFCRCMCFISVAAPSPKSINSQTRGRNTQSIGQEFRVFCHLFGEL